ncbi:MAG: pyridoxine 5'-phosphate synthase, partial [Hydrogenobacter sp.]
AVELHTGRYANLWKENNKKELEEEIEKLKKAGMEAKRLGLRVYAGHGLTYQNVRYFVRELRGIVEELNVGHSIISNSVIFGLEKAVKEFLSLIKE